MSEDLHALLADLARYLRQQQSAGSTFYLDDPTVRVEADEPAVAKGPPGGTAAPSADAPAPAPPTPAAPRPAPATGPEPMTQAEPATPPAPTEQPAPRERALGEREEAFRRECEAFVRDTLALIARTRAHVPSTPRAGAEQTDIFGSAPDPVAPPPPAPEAPADKAAALETIAAEARACTACVLHGSRQQAVPGTGNPDAGLVLIGEAPGAEEDRQGLPFVGRSGQLLTDILKAIGFSRDEVFICNILKCRPPANRDPERAEVEACEPFLRRQLQVIRPRLILCLGRVAAQTLLGTTAPLGSLRRSVHFYAGVPVMATFHPAALLRNPGHKRDTWDDVRKLRALHDALGPPEA